MFSQSIKLSGIVSLVGNLFVFLRVASPTAAQIIPDNTLGNESSVVVPNQNIRGINSDRIDGGAVRGGNLFHSFQEFNVDVGRGAYFSNPDSIVNILTRVTGDNLSNILGTLGVLGNANLFLINPNGIVFGPNARLDVGGSFFASTADGILFENGVEFAASNPEAPPLLTINIPLGLNIRENPGTIRVEGTGHNLSSDSETGEIIRENRPLGLQVPNGQTLALVGGDLLIEGGNLTVEEGRVELGSVRGNSQVNLNSTNLGWMLNYDAVPEFSDIQLSLAASIDVRGEQGGTIGIQGRQIKLTEASRIETRTLGVGGQAELTVKASESVEVTDVNTNQIPSSLISIAEGVGQGGNTTIQTPQLVIRNGADVGTATLSVGNAGNVNVIASDVELAGVAFDGNPAILAAAALTGSSGNAGNVRIETGRLTVRDGAIVATATQGQGNAGDVTVIASEFVELSALNGETTGLVAGTDEGTTGNAGNIRIETGRLTVRDGAGVVTSTQGQGNAGDITIIASEVVELRGASNGEPTGLIATTLGGTGDAGNVRIETGRLIVRDGAFVATVTAGEGSAGEINIIASDSVELSASNGEPTGLVAGAVGGTGDAGNVWIETGRLIVRNGASVATATLGQGNAGNVTVIASEVVELSGASNGETTSLVAGVAPGGTGDAGNVRIETGRLIVRDGAGVVTRTQGQGNAGDITIIASESVELEGVSADGNASGLFANTSIDTDINNNLSEDSNLIGGDAGNINVETNNLTIHDGGQITASSILSQGNAGDINIEATESVQLSNELNRDLNGLVALSLLGTGNAGSINIRTGRLMIGKNTFILAGAFLSFENSQAGNITITADAVEVLEEGRINAETGGAGDAGNITIETGELRLEDRATITVQSQSLDSQDFSEFEIQQFTNSDASLFVQLISSLFSSRAEQSIGEPGNINIQASEVLLNNQASLNAASENGNGGNITVASPDIFLRRQSEIVATGNASGETLEGNINIGTNFLVLLENSRIVTDASNPTGGSNITIRPFNDSELAILQSQNTTIRAAGELSIDDTLNFDPPESPEVTVVDPAALIAQDPCKQRGDSEFIITGRGGIASSPHDIFTGDRTQVPLVEPVEPVRSSPNRSTSTQRPRTEPNQPRSSADIVPARGWIRDENGDVILVSYDPTKAGVRRQPQQYPNQCHNNE